MRNSLTASAGIGQMRNGKEEHPLVTLCDLLEAVRESLLLEQESYTAAEVIARLLE